MPCDLEVDTDQLRRASALSSLAAAVLGMPSRRWRDVDAAQRAATGPAAFREAVRLAATRADQCLDCLDVLAGRAETLAGLLRSTAAGFDRAEMLCSAGR